MSDAFVRVAVPVPLHRTFTYRLPAPLHGSPGCRVRVPFGPRKLVGVVVEGPLDDAPEGIEPHRIKAVEDVLDTQPVLSARTLELCAWMATYYHLPPGEAYLLPLPPGMTGGRRGQVRTEPFQHETVARWLRPPGQGVRLGKAMAQVLAWLEAKGAASSSEIKEATGYGLDVLRRLERHQTLELTRRRVSRDPFSRIPLEAYPAPALTADQEQVLAKVSSSLGGYEGFLLMGVTGSGKTEVYLRLIEQVLDRGEGALVLVPEIALTPQLVARFRGRFGDRIAVLHSGLDAPARHEQWLRIAAGELPVVIGARSALFAPLARPGILIADEEHDPSYKQDTAPRYHARDLALMRGHLEDCPVVLGTATPSVESWQNVAAGKLTRLDLPERVEARPMPDVSLIDLRTASFSDPDRIFSTTMSDAIVQNLDRGEQTILFLNRRGYASFVLCRGCGDALTCPSCSVSYTWHRGRNRLVCHYCDRVDQLPASCPGCGDDALEDIGHGTERIEASLGSLVPAARVARMDRDTTRGHALTRLLGAFRRREIDILVGTQMVAKGHDFPGVTLVGVLLAEMGLRLPDFRASERTFQLLTQIAGRAGRADKPGRVLVQTYTPDHYALEHARTHGAAPFLEEEIGIRRARDFPPFSHLALLRLKGRDRQVTWREADRLAHALHAFSQARADDSARAWVIGPQLAPVERINDQWRFQILLKAPSRTSMAGLLNQGMAWIDTQKRPAGVQLSLDVDPQAFL